MEAAGEVPLHVGSSWPSIDAAKGTLMGMAAAPLLLIAIYFFKASPELFSKEHGISLLAYICALFLTGVGIVKYGIAFVLSAFQILPIVNTIFLGSFTMCIESFVSMGLAGMSLYFAMLGYAEAAAVKEYSVVGMIAFVLLLVPPVLRLLQVSRGFRDKIEEWRLSDMTCTLIFSGEAALAFVSFCTLAPVFGGVFPLVGCLASLSFLFPVERALYYYPATAVIPIFTVCVRLLGAAFAWGILANTSPFLVSASLATGVVSALFPLLVA